MSIPAWLSVLFAILGLAALFALALFVSRRAARRAGSARPEELLLEEAVVLEPLAPGMDGKAALKRKGADLAIRIRAVDGNQAFSRGTRVRILDCRDGAYLVEPADEEHLVH